MGPGTVTGQLTSLPGRYAKALFSLAENQGAIEETFDNLNGIEKLLKEHTDLHSAISSPVFSEDERLAVLSEVLKKIKSHKLMIDFFGRLIKNDRLHHLSAIIRAYSNLMIEGQGATPVVVYTTIKLSAKQVKRLESVLSKYYGDDLRIRYRIKPEITGGVIIRSRSRVIDASLATQFRQLATDMKGA